MLLQVPQFVLDSMISSGAGSRASIIVTQPRRLSAIGVSARVAQERVNDGSVAYSIRGETSQTKHTKLLFCTTGVVLRRLSVGDQLRNVSHVIVDEVLSVILTTRGVINDNHIDRFMSVPSTATYCCWSSRSS
jgi:ATP-dependent RNA helicase DHX57